MYCAGVHRGQPGKVAETVPDIGEEGDRDAVTARLEDCICEICFAWEAAMETKLSSSRSFFRSSDFRWWISSLKCEYWSEFNP